MFLGFANAEIVTKTVTKTSSGEGHGLTREEAIKKSGVYAASSNKGTDILVVVK